MGACLLVGGSGGQVEFILTEIYFTYLFQTGIAPSSEVLLLLGEVKGGKGHACVVTLLFLARVDHLAILGDTVLVMLEFIVLILVQGTSPHHPWVVSSDYIVLWGLCTHFTLIGKLLDVF